ncbi:phosphoribosylpyrophosphate synthetase [Flavobacteriaceae bacterium Ap0902]|nr:phosphoribosylpyrophosphate synthetase [Flavobacteriaceae bacterium Ap0902]
MLKKSYDTVVEAIQDLQKEGYTLDFSILTEQDCIFCRSTEDQLSPDDFKIDGVYRFEGETDPGDSMVVYAISSTDESLKGTLVNAYGMYADKASSKLIKKLETHQA